MARCFPTFLACRSLGAFLFAIWTPTVCAQHLGRPFSESSTPISRFVPASTQLYVSISQLGEVNEALHRVNAWRWLPYLLDDTTDGALPADLLEGVARLMGTAGSDVERDLRYAEVGIAASSLSALDRAVWFVRLPDPQAADRWFPGERRTAQADFGIARSFRTNDGLIACQRDGILALARWLQGDSIALTTMYLMRGRSGPVLHDLPLLRRAHAYLPSKPLATVFVPGRQTTIDPSKDASVPEATIKTGTDDSGEFVAALYEAENGLDIAIRGANGHVAPQPTITPDVVERLLQLPRTTLVAVAQGIDWSSMTESQGERSPTGWLARYGSYLFRAQGVFAGVDSSVIVAWDQSFQGSSSTPQLAALVRTDSPDSLKSAMVRAAQRMVDLMSVMASEPTAAPIRVNETTHLGTPISCAPLQDYVGASGHTFMHVLGGVEPCWAYTGGWFVVTIGRDHLQRILDAQNGLAPSLGSMREASTLRSRRSRMQLAALVQGELAAHMLDEWLTGADAQDSLLSASLWNDLTRTQDPPRKRIGIGVRAVDRSGCVVVGRVSAGTAADGLLEVGDQIIGVDGALLAMDDPNVDLRARLARSSAQPGPTLRVLRNGELRDVVLSLDSGTAPSESPTMSPADAAGELASLIRSLPFASLVIGTADDNHYAARMSLRFASEATVTQIPPE